MKPLITFGIIFSCLALPVAKAEQHLPDFGNQVANVVDSRLKECGLQLVNPHQRGFAYPTRWNARYAVVNHRGQLLAYSVRNIGAGGVQWAWMNPNGGYRHSIEVNNRAVRFVTPLAGNVASANRFVTPAGVGYNMYCRAAGGMLPAWPAFESCVVNGFVDVVVGQLCRFAQ